jgi:exodeoxyribonuclease VII large subunit
MAADEKSIPSFLDLRSARTRKSKPRAVSNDLPQLAFDLSLPLDPVSAPIAIQKPEPILTSARKPADPILYTVRQLIAELRQHVEGAYTGILNVEGEISNCRPAASGHLYFTLKDGDAQLPVVLFRRNAQLLAFKPKDGLSVEVRGRISVYETRGQLQLIAESLRPRGTGALQLAFEQLRDRLRREGLFDRPRTPLPPFPHCIGIVTSPSGAAIRDIIHVIRRRHARLNLLIYPAVMQGAQCPPSVIRGIRFFNEVAQNRVLHVSPLRRGFVPPEIPCVDLILVARGGGSLEDLAGFNDEALARAIVASKLPVVSAIGHEIDHTIADYVADLRAPTPSAAAELITAAQHRIEERVASLERRVNRAAEFHLLRARQRLQRLSAEQVLARLRDAIGRRQQRIDELRFRLDYANARLQRHNAGRVAALETRLLRHDPTVRIAHIGRRLETAKSRLAAVSRQITTTRRTRLERATLRLNALSPLAVLNRGYAIVYLEGSGEETILQNAAEAQPNQTIRARLAQGTVRARVIESKP